MSYTILSYLSADSLKVHENELQKIENYYYAQYIYYQFVFT